MHWPWRKPKPEPDYALAVEIAQAIERFERAWEKAVLRQPHVEHGIAELEARNLPPGSVLHQRVYHDGWYPIFTGGLCRCDPDITYAPEEP